MEFQIEETERSEEIPCLVRTWSKLPDEEEANVKYDKLKKTCPQQLAIGDWRWRLEIDWRLEIGDKVVCLEVIRANVKYDKLKKTRPQQLEIGDKVVASK
ncbi:predicted protein [Chaetoceros tenuissimus]|uniref:Uncharacterized protein n=1 Tax=Chaetoceros tenuissimus TaxID=426638 RepID=A0AAD3H0M6_9STRA|nr:predicted protein [Chaetoceros tenuissimus]